MSDGDELEASLEEAILFNENNKRFVSLVPLSHFWLSGRYLC